MISFWICPLLMMLFLFCHWEPFLVSFGLIASTICCVNRSWRSRIPRNSVAEEPREPLPRRRSGATNLVNDQNDQTQARSPLPGRKF